MRRLDPIPPEPDEGDHLRYLRWYLLTMPRRFWRYLDIKHPKNGGVLVVSLGIVLFGVLFILPLFLHR